MKTFEIIAPDSIENTPVACEYDMLFSETRLPTFTEPLPQHTITLASTETAHRLYLRSEKARSEIEQAIRSGQLKEVSLSDEILGIEFVQHLGGWPLEQEAESYLSCVPLDKIERANVHVPSSPSVAYETAFLNRNLSVLDYYSPVKTAVSFAYDPKKDLRQRRDKVCVVAEYPENRYHRVVVYLDSAKSAGHLRYRLARPDHTWLNLNGWVRSIWLYPRPDAQNTPFLVYGADELSDELKGSLRQRGILPTASGLWCKAVWTQEDANGMFI